MLDIVIIRIIFLKVFESFTFFFSIRRDKKWSGSISLSHYNSQCCYYIVTRKINLTPGTMRQVRLDFLLRSEPLSRGCKNNLSHRGSLRKMNPRVLMRGRWSVQALKEIPRQRDERLLEREIIIRRSRIA